MKTTPRRTLAGSLIVGLLLWPFAGCENLPGTDEQQGAVAGGAGGAAIGAAVAEDNRLLGALIGGAAGAGGGYLIGANKDKILGSDDDPDTTEAETRQAIADAQQTPATVEDVRDDNDADLNDDGFVTTDELLAMTEADLSDEEIVTRLRRTDQVFDLSQSQREYLTARGVSDDVVAALDTINRQDRERLLTYDDPRVLSAEE